MDSERCYWFSSGFLVYFMAPATLAYRFISVKLAEFLESSLPITFPFLYIVSCLSLSTNKISGNKKWQERMLECLPQTSYQEITPSEYVLVHFWRLSGSGWGSSALLCHDGRKDWASWSTGCNIFGAGPSVVLRLCLTGGPGLREIRDSDGSLNNILSLVFFLFSSDE